jgi:hypothetical protein
MTTAAPLARYGAMWRARVASGSATAELHHHLGHDPARRALAALMASGAFGLHNIRRGWRLFLKESQDAMEDMRSAARQTASGETLH